MCVGYRVVDVQDRAGVADAEFAAKNKAKHAKQGDRWFEHNAVWFDAADERTERQLLYAIPFFKERCRNVTVFETKQKLREAIEPFKQKQLAIKQQSEKAK